MSADVLSIATQNATLWTSDLFDAETRAEAGALLKKGGDALIEPKEDEGSELGQF